LNEFQCIHVESEAVLAEITGYISHPTILKHTHTHTHTHTQRALWYF